MSVHGCSTVRTVADPPTRRPRRLAVHLFTYSAALIGGLLISASWLHRIGGLSVRLPLRFLSTHLGTRLGALGLLRGGRLSLHLPLGVLRRGRNISAGAVHGACRRMLLAVIADSHCLAGTLRCRSGPCILQVRGAASGVTWASQCSSGAQDDRGINIDF